MLDSSAPTINSEEQEASPWLVNGKVTYSRSVNATCASEFYRNGLVTVTSPLNYLYWENQLGDHPDLALSSKILHYMRHGAPTGYSGPQRHRERPNWPSAEELSSEVRTNILADAKQQRIIGPFRDKPFDNLVCSPLGAFKKKRSQKIRTIHDLSYPPGLSVNEYIADEHCTTLYSSVYDAVDICNQIRNTEKCDIVYGCKIDISDAFKHIVIDPADWHLMGSILNNVNKDKEYWFSTVLEFGLRSAPKTFNLFGEGLQYIMQQNGVKNVIRYMDDYACFASNETLCNAYLENMISVCELAGFKLQPAKVVRATPVLEFLGIVIDNVKQELRISVERMSEIKALLADWEVRKKCTKRELLSLLGKLMFCSKVIRCGKTFTYRLIQLSKKCRYLHYKINLNSEARSDIQWWKDCISSHNGVGTFPKDWISDRVLHLYTDASDVAIAGVCQSRWFYRYYTGSYLKVKDTPIAYRELLALVISILTFADKLHGRRLILHVDNQVVVQAINNGYVRNDEMMILIRKLYYVFSVLSIECRAVYISTKDNDAADALSRGRVDNFKQNNPDSDEHMTWPETLILGKCTFV